MPLEVLEPQNVYVYNLIDIKAILYQLVKKVVLDLDPAVLETHWILDFSIISKPATAMFNVVIFWVRSKCKWRFWILVLRGLSGIGRFGSMARPTLDESTNWVGTRHQTPMF